MQQRSKTKRRKRVQSEGLSVYREQLLPARCRLTSGKDLLPHVDKRSVWSKRFHDLIDHFAHDLGGMSNLTTAEMELVRRCACLGVEIARVETEIAQCEKEKTSPRLLDGYQRLVGAQRRLFETLYGERGLPRRSRADAARDVTPFAPSLAKVRRLMSEPAEEAL